MDEKEIRKNIHLETRKAEDKMQRARRNISEKEKVVRNRRPPETAPGHSQKIGEVMKMTWREN